MLSEGAKFIGSSMGGVQVTLEDALTGELLAIGVTKGGTGDTEKIMKTAHRRGAGLSTEDAAKFEATLDIDAPTRVRATVHGPLVQEQAANTVSASRWVLRASASPAATAGCSRCQGWSSTSSRRPRT